ncbi:hypothetical protein HDZ31DRAFT_65717 [Schizophyllum fasciatum]
MNNGSESDRDLRRAFATERRSRHTEQARCRHLEHRAQFMDAERNREQGIALQLCDQLDELNDQLRAFQNSNESLQASLNDELARIGGLEARLLEERLTTADLRVELDRERRLTRRGERRARREHRAEAQAQQRENAELRAQLEEERDRGRGLRAYIGELREMLTRERARADVSSDGAQGARDQVQSDTQRDSQDSIASSGNPHSPEEPTTSHPQPSGGREDAATFINGTQRAQEQPQVQELHILPARGAFNEQSTLPYPPNRRDATVHPQANVGRHGSPPTELVSPYYATRFPSGQNQSRVAGLQAGNPVGGSEDSGTPPNTPWYPPSIAYGPLTGNHESASLSRFPLNQPWFQRIVQPPILASSEALRAQGRRNREGTAQDGQDVGDAPPHPNSEARVPLLDRVEERLARLEERLGDLEREMDHFEDRMETVARSTGHESDGDAHDEDEEPRGRTGPPNRDLSRPLGLREVRRGATPGPILMPEVNLPLSTVPLPSAPEYPAGQEERGRHPAPAGLQPRGYNPVMNAPVFRRERIGQPIPVRPYAGPANAAVPSVPPAQSAAPSSITLASHADERFGRPLPAPPHRAFPQQNARLQLQQGGAIPTSATDTPDFMKMAPDIDSFVIENTGQLPRSYGRASGSGIWRA